MQGERFNHCATDLARIIREDKFFGYWMLDYSGRQVLWILDVGYSGRQVLWILDVGYSGRQVLWILVIGYSERQVLRKLDVQIKSCLVSKFQCTMAKYQMNVKRFDIGHSSGQYVVKGY